MSGTEVMRRAALVAVVAMLAACRSQDEKPELHGAVLDPPAAAPEMHLTDHRGRSFDLSEHDGKVVLVYFGFTNCPDVCPITLATIRGALEQLTPQQRSDVLVALVTVDPERDTPDALADYLAAFDPDFLGLSGAPDELQAVYDGFGIAVTKQDLPDSDLGYTIDHTASVVVIDPKGRTREMWMHGTPAEAMAADIKTLLGGS